MRTGDRRVPGVEEELRADEDSLRQMENQSGNERQETGKRAGLLFCLSSIKTDQNFVQTEPLSAELAQALIQRMPSIPASISG